MLRVTRWVLKACWEVAGNQKTRLLKRESVIGPVSSFHCKENTPWALFFLFFFAHFALIDFFPCYIPTAGIIVLGRGCKCSHETNDTRFPAWHYKSFIVARPKKIKRHRLKVARLKKIKRHRLKVEKQSLRLTIKQSKSSACELLIITHRFNWGCRDSASNIEEPCDQVQMIFSIALLVFLYQNQ